MTINTKMAAVYAYAVAPRDPTPLVRGWNRLEGRPRSADFDRSLRADVRDPLWFLTRQWQYGEFEGDDAGSPIDARVAYASAKIDGYSTGDAAASVAFDAATPLETRVESEPPPFDLMLHMQAARVFEQLLDKGGLAARMSDYVDAFKLDFEHAVDGEDTVAARSLYRLGAAKLLDAAKLLAALGDGTHATIVAGFPGMTSTQAAKLAQAGSDLVDWFGHTYSTPVPTTTAWQGERLAYRFKCSASAASISFVAEHYDGGHLDWTAFDVVREGNVAPAAPTQALSFLPASIQFSGMPSPRYWEMEDAKTEFGHLDVNTNDLAKLLLAEFMLICSNDWCLFPLELDVGTFTRVEGLLVTDVFGDQTLVRAADRGADSAWQRWSMFRMNGDDASSPGLLLVPALTSTVSAPPVERVHFLRDEMANMVWAIENRVMDRTGEPFDPAVGIVPPAAPPATNAPARYVLGTYVPSNWRPFVPVLVPGSTRSIRLQRARLPDQPLKPVGRILDSGAPYIAEEEVPRAGRIVERQYKRARWVGGAAFLWVGRRSITGRGEGSSGLVFDQVEEVPKKSD